jgi:hypothetical protein
MKSLALATVALLSASIAAAESLTNPPPPKHTDPAAQAELLAAHRATIVQAKAYAKANNAAAAEQALAPLLRAQPGTADWHLQMAQRLIHIATDLAREAQPKAVELASWRALQQVEAGVRSTTDARRLAAAHGLAGSIHERFTGDGEAAVRSYEAALRHAPESQGLHEKLRRLRPNADDPQRVGENR